MCLLGNQLRVVKKNFTPSLPRLTQGLTGMPKKLAVVLPPKEPECGCGSLLHMQAHTIQKMLRTIGILESRISRLEAVDSHLIRIGKIPTTLAFERQQ